LVRARAYGVGLPREQQFWSVSAMDFSSPSIALLDSRCGLVPENPTTF
jgi:hypothetical protein